MGQLNYSRMNELILSLIGSFEQVPPIYSAVKYKGKPSYYYARKNQQLELKPKIVKIHDIELISLINDTLVLKIICSSGTYIRSIANKIGYLMGCGAVVDGLVRNKIGSFDLKEGIGVDNFKDLSNDLNFIKSTPSIIPIGEVLLDNYSFYVKSDYEKQVLNGVMLSSSMLDFNKSFELNESLKKEFLNEGEFVNIKGHDGNLLAVHEMLNSFNLKIVENVKTNFTKSIVILN